MKNCCEFNYIYLLETMKETRFIEKNKEKWAKFEKEKARKNANPEELSKLYAEINNDLSQARTFYNKRTVRAYLNNLAQGLHKLIYKQKPISFKKIVETWTVDIPISIFRARKNLLIAFILFLVWAFIGVISTHFNPDFASKVMGYQYIQMTEQNLKEGNPMGVYGFSPQSTMFFQITLNNIKVALLAFFSGILFTIGTHVILFNNAVMVGVFQYYFKLKGLFLTSFLAIWIHGAFEISAIIVASGAGLTIGHGLLFPGSYTRFQSIQRSARDGIRIMISLIPVFIIAGFLESFVTRNYLLLPDWSKFMVIGFSFLCMIFYYIIYPRMVAKKHPEKVYEKPEVKPLKNKLFKLFSLRKTSDLFKDGFSIYRILFNNIFFTTLKVVGPIIIVILLFQNFIHADQMNVGYDFDWMAQLSILFGNYHSTVFKGWTDLLVGVVWTIPITLTVLIAFYELIKQDTQFQLEGLKSYIKSKFLKTSIPIFIVLMIFIHISIHFVWVSVFILPYIAIWIGKSAFSEIDLKSSVSQLTKKVWSDGIGVLVLLSVFTFLIVQPVAFFLSINEGVNNSPILPDFLDMITSFLERILASETEYAVFIGNVIRQIVYLLLIMLLIPLYTILLGLYFFHAADKEESISLKEQLKNFGKLNNDG